MLSYCYNKLKHFFNNDIETEDEIVDKIATEKDHLDTYISLMDKYYNLMMRTNLNYDETYPDPEDLIDLIDELFDAYKEAIFN